MKEPEMRIIADFISRGVDVLEDRDAQAGIQEEVRAFCAAFPAPGIRIS
jgi:glycine/serine hydroxymethyltransferase